MKKTEKDNQIDTLEDTHDAEENQQNNRSHCERDSSNHHNA